MKKLEPEKSRTPREVAVYLYAKWLQQRDRIEPHAQQALQQWGWERRDRALFLEILYGVIRNHRRIEWIIRKLSSQDETRHQTAYAAAAIGVYQILYLDRVPDFAVVDTAVDLTRRAHGPMVAGWVNAILRTIGREKEHWFTKVPETRDKYYNLSVEYSYPQWMVERWAKVMSEEQLKEFLTWNNRRPRVIYRINQTVATVPEAQQILKARGITTVVSEVNPFFLIQKRNKSFAGEIITEGLTSVQDHAQGLVAQLVAPQLGEIILDFCAAPGGKTGHLAELGVTSKIVATDKNADRLKTVQELANLPEYSNIEVKNYQDVLNSGESYDAILVDAPCTGTGVLARRPDLRWRREQGDIPRLAATQFQILRYAADRVKPGGRIIYSTCSVEREENIGVVAEFLKAYPSFKEVRSDTFLDQKFLDQEHRLNLLGPEIKGDGVFAVRLEKQIKGR